MRIETTLDEEGHNKHVKRLVELRHWAVPLAMPTRISKGVGSGGTQMGRGASRSWAARAIRRGGRVVPVVVMPASVGASLVDQIVRARRGRTSSSASPRPSAALRLPRCPFWGVLGPHFSTEVEQKLRMGLRGT